LILAGAIWIAAAPAHAQPDDGAPLAISQLQIHGFVSEGAFISTANDYIGTSSRGSLELFEAGLNVSTDVADRLRAGIQFYARNIGTFDDLPPRLDWAFLDYRWRDWLGVRAGVIKMPYGLYNEYADIDAARTSILMPQSVYAIASRSALISHTGFTLYGERDLGGAGSLEYQAWFGTLTIPFNAFNLNRATLDRIDPKYVTGAQVYWKPIDGLKVGGTFIRASIDYDLHFDAEVVDALVAMGRVPPTYDGKISVFQRPTTLVIGSAEYLRDDWAFAAEYARSFLRQRTTLPDLVPTDDSDVERFYVRVSRRLCRCYSIGAYYSAFHVDAHDRQGRDAVKFPVRVRAWQRDAAVSIRYDVNDHWLWKAEAHFIDGVADLSIPANPDPTRYWGLFLIRTTVTF
jgi:hypothetical protein